MNNIHKITFAVIVTYSNRFHLLRQAIDAAFREGVDKIFVVDNCSHPDSRKQLKTYELSHPNRLIVTYLDENMGSAGGFKQGIKAAYGYVGDSSLKSKCDFIWLLDDDNVPQSGALSKLRSGYRSLEDSHDLLALSSYRIDTTTGKEIVQKGLIRRYSTNNFGGFNFFETIYRKLTNLVTYKTSSTQPKLTSILYAAYGGLFLPRETIDVIGFPNEEFFLYVDDQDYSYRIVKNGGKIWYCPESVVKDADEEKDSTVSAYRYFRKSTSNMKIYYTIRNQVYFGKQFQTNKLTYYSNMWMKLFILGLFSLSNVRLLVPRFRLIMRAIKDGHEDRLGKTFGVLSTWEM